MDATNIADTTSERSEPFLVRGRGVQGEGQASGSTPMVMGQQSGARALDVEESPAPTIATRGAIHYLEPTGFVLPRNGAYRGIHSNPAYDPGERPLHTVTAKNLDGHLVSAFLVPYYGEREGQSPRIHDFDDPFPTVTATGSDPYLVAPYLIEYYGNGNTQPVNEPLPTVTTKDRFALCIPEHWPWGLDIRYRMLQPRELKQAQGFPEDYELVGSKRETTKQIGNAVPVNLAKALCTQLLTGDEPSLQTFTPQKTVAADD